ncbi:DUF805 domain-containing protein [Xylanimonas allomyrinae]|uniref:DUF805 domain-containing protein n=1 Tax=Xylanimonas allomyrinae TaxID=2509459 RepID=A0A4P6EMJ1_9MICO|nr:DUF805 domain-containing protein [Xylanimonas allomyrinae]QAY63872.1 DUF805 domain-containing protein [Xylanimonas allomyrinae]
MSMVDAVKSVFSKYATFNGRARRAEYWWFALAMAIVSAVLSAVLMPIALSSVDVATGEIGAGYYAALIPLWVVSLAVLLPGLAVTVRRLHDTGRPGGWIFIALVPFVGGILLIVFTATAGTVGPNQFGPDPKAVQA